MLTHDLSWTASKGRLASQQIKGHDSEGILIAGWHGIALPLFGRHVGRSTAYTLAGRRGSIDKFSNTEISQQDIWRIGYTVTDANEEVRRFDILVKYLSLVRMLQSISSLEQNLHHFRSGIWVSSAR